MKKVSQGIKSTLLKTTILRTLLWGLLVGFGFVSTSEAFAQELPTISVSVPQDMPLEGYEKGEIVPLTIAVTAQGTVLTNYISTDAGTGTPSEFYLKIVDQTPTPEVGERLIRLRYVLLPGVATSVLQQATEMTDPNNGDNQVIWSTLQSGTLNYIVAGDLAYTVAVSVINVAAPLVPTTNAGFSAVVPTFPRKKFVENTEVLDAVTDSPLISIRPVNAIYERGYWTSETIDFTLSINDNIVINDTEYFDVMVNNTSQGAYLFKSKELYKIDNLVLQKVDDNKVTLTMDNANQTVSLKNTSNSTAYVTSAQTYTLNFLSTANRPQLYMGPVAKGTGIGTSFANCRAFEVIAAGLIPGGTDIYLASGEYSTAAALTPNGFFVNPGTCIYGGYQGSETDMQVAPSKRKMRTPSDKQIGLFGVGPVNETTFNFANNFTMNLRGLDLSGANYIDGINIMNATTAFTSLNDPSTISNCKVYDCREMVNTLSDLTINNSVFYANGQTLSGRIQQILTTNESHATFNNCIFGANRSQNANFINGNVTFNHCIITRNDNASPNLFISARSNVFFKNSVLFNQHGGASFTANDIGVTCENFYTDQMANAPTGAIHFTPTDAMSAFVNPDLNAWGIGATADQLAKNAAFDFRLTRTSILTNAGASTPVTYDITGQPRSGSAPDVGCYETQLPNIANAQRLYVGANALSSTEDIRNCDGSTWEKALPNFLLDDVFQRKSVKEIFLTGGDFVLNTPQTLERSLSIYGGFNGGETTVDSRSNPILRISSLGYYTQSTVLRMPSTQTNGMFKITENDVVFNGIGFSRAGGATTTENGGYINLENTGPNVFKNCYFDHLSTTGNGGGIYSSAKTTGLTFENCAFDTLQAENGGAVYSLSSGDLSFNQCRFNSNSATKNGGAIYAEQANNVIIKNSHTQNAQEIVNNKATLNGGFLYTNSDVTTVTLDTILAYGKIEGNAIPVHANKGGLVFVNATTTALSLNNASINHLQVDAHTSDDQTPVTTPSTGGVIASLSTETLTLNNCTFSSNSALGTDGSGGVVSHAGVITATKMGEINGNHASVASVFSTTGAISIDGATKINDNKGTLFHALGSFNIKNVQEIKDNKNIADTDGTSLVDQTTTGTINLENIDLYSGNGTISSRTQNQNAVTITNSKFDNNNLGANYLVSGATDVKTNSMICTNNISMAGLLNATASISVDSKTLFENNSIGASLLHAPTITAKNSRFIKNSATGNGIIESTTSVTLDSCRFFSNTANNNAIANVTGTFNATHCIFSNNHSATASNISTAGNATIDNSLFAFNTGLGGAILTSTAVADVTNCTIAKNNDLSTATVASNTLNIPTTIDQVKNTIFWGNRGGVAATLQLPKEVSSYCAIEGDVNNRSALTDDANTIIIKATRTDARGPRFQQYNLIDKSAGANSTYTVADLDELLFNIDSYSPCINRGDGEIQNMTDLMGNTRISKNIVDIGAHESNQNGIAFVKMVPDTGFYGVVGGHSSKIVLSEPENFPSPNFIEVDKFKVANSTEFKKVFYESEESIGLKKYLTPNTQEGWRYFPAALNYEILSAKLTLDIQCKMGSTPFKPGDEVTMNELLTFNVLTNREKADVKCEYAGTTYTVGTGLTPPPFTRALQSQSNIFTFTASGKNYEPISKTITITATTEEEGYVVVVNGISQGLKKQGDSLSLKLEGAPAGRAIWSCTNGAIVVPELDRISNPFHFTMPKKRVVLEAHGRDFYVGTNALGTGDGRSQLNRAAATNLPMILDSASALSIIDHTGVRSENFVFVDSGTYKGTQDSHVAFTIPTYTKMVGTKDVVFENNQNTYLFELTPHAGLFNIKIDGLNNGTTTGVYTQTENATSSIDSVLIVGCKGDAVYAMGKSIIKISKSNIQANQVALHVKDAVIDATNCLIAHNTAEALKVESTSNYAKTKGTLLHCTIVNNSTTPLSSRNQYSIIEVNNSILWHATGVITLPAANAILTGCAIKAANSLAKNILITTEKTVDFVTPASIVDTANWANYNWNLKPTSVCINRAEPTKTGLLSFDIQDSPRYAYAVPDIGAYEVDTKGHSYATFEKDHVVYNASEVKLALKDDASYPGKDDFVSFTPSIIDSGIYQNVTPTGMNWTYAQATVTVDSAPLTSFTINNNISENNTSPLSELNINCTATGLNNVMVQGIFEILTVDGKTIVDSSTILPQVDSVFGYVFTPFKNYAPNIGTFQVDCQWQALEYEVIYKTHEIEYGQELITAVDTAYGVIKDGNGIITDTIYGDYAFQVKMIAPVGTRNYFLDFKPLYGQNQKPSTFAVEVTITPLKIPEANLVDSIIVTDTMYVYGQSVEPKVYLHATLEGKDSVLLRTTDYTISFSTDKDFLTTTTPIIVGTYYIKIVSTQQCNYNFTRLDSCIITQKPLFVAVKKTTTSFGTKPMPASVMTGLAYDDQIPYTLETNWGKDSAVGSYANEFVFTPSVSTDSYLVTITGDTSLTISNRHYSEEEILIKEPDNLIYDGNPKIVTITSLNPDTIVLTENDYTITYDASTTLPGTVNYTVVFKNNFIGDYSGAYEITLEDASIKLADLKQKYDGTKKQATVTAVGTFSEIHINYLKEGQVVANYTGVIEPGIYTVQATAKQSGSSTPFVIEKPFEIYTTPNIVAFDVITETIKEGDSVILVAHLVDTPSEQTSVPFILNATIDNTLYKLSAKEFTFAKNLRTDSIVLTSISDKRSNPAANIKLTLFSSSVTIEDEKSSCSITINDDEDHTLDPEVVVSELKFIENQLTMSSSTPLTTLRLLSGASADVTLKFSSMSTGDLTCNGILYDGGKGVTLPMIEGVNPITVVFASEKLKTLKKVITASVSKISSSDLHLTKVAADKTCKITYVNDAPVLMTDNVSVMFENDVQDEVYFDVLKNDKPYFDALLPSGELVITALSTTTINNIKLSVENQKLIKADFSDCSKDDLIKGFTVQFSYTVNQVGAGAAEGIVNMTVALKQVKGAEIEIKGQNITKKTPVIATYEDPFKKPSKTGTRTRSFKMKRTSDTSALLSTTIVGFNKSALAKAYGNGSFFADMFNKEDSTYTYTSQKTLIQVASIGSHMNDKPAKGQEAQDFGSWNISPSENIQLGTLDSVILIYSSKGVIVDSIAFSETLRDSNGKTYAIISGDYFGSTPTAYLEYLADNGKIKKVSLSVCKSVSVKSITSGKTLKWSSKNANFGNLGKGSKIILLWPTKASLDKLKHAYTTDGRIDLIINNASFQTPVKNFQNNSQNIVK